MDRLINKQNILFGLGGLILSFIVFLSNVTAQDTSTFWDIGESDYKKYIVPSDGLYKIELWGVKEGRVVVNDSFTYIISNDPGNEVYTLDEIYLKKDMVLYIYVDDLDENIGILADLEVIDDANKGYINITLLDIDGIITNVSLEDALVVKKSLLEYDVYLKTNHHETGDFQVEYAGNVTSITGKSNVNLDPGTTNLITVTTLAGNILIYELNMYEYPAVLDYISFDYGKFDFDPLIFNYEITVENTITKLTPTIIADEQITYNVNSSDLSYGENYIVIDVQGPNMIDSSYTFKVIRNESDISDKIYDFEHSANVQTFVVPYTGYYKIETWGASGGLGVNSHFYVNNTNGKGAYVSGKIYLKEGTILYIYVGGKGEDAGVYETAKGGFNGGGNGEHDHSDDESAAGGGGATDIRLISGEWNDFNSLKSRIMVAGGGGGASGSGSATEKITGGYGGTLEGQSRIYSTGGTQTKGYAFGKGMNAIFTDTNVDVGGGGGGYYGGYAISSGKASVYNTPGAGGSSFVSGAIGCDAIDITSTENNIIHTGQSNHYSGYVFRNIEMKAGNEEMPSYTNVGTMIGNSYDGYARISYIAETLTVLESITLSRGILVPDFSSDTYEYTVNLEPSVTKVSIAATTNNNVVAIAGTQDMIVPVGTSERIITLTDIDGSIATYKITFTR